MTDRIELTGIRARGFHGVLEEEKLRGQDFVVDVALLVDTRFAAASDDLADTVDYSAVARAAVEVVAGPSKDLIEAVAGEIAEKALRFDRVEGVEVTVHKPSAPVGVPFSDVTVTVRREREIPAVIGLGANLGLREHTLACALREIDRLPGTSVVAVSDLVETDPWGGVEQPDYLNAVALVRTRLGAATLLAELHAVEERHGRTREVRWGARTLDLDLLQHGTPGAGETRVATDGLTLPHPRAHERAFVLLPWAQADPAARLSVGDDVSPVTELAERVGDQGVRPGPAWPSGVPGR